MWQNQIRSKKFVRLTLIRYDLKSEIIWRWTIRYSTRPDMIRPKIRNDPILDDPIPDPTWPDTIRNPKWPDTRWPDTRLDPTDLIWPDSKIFVIMVRAWKLWKHYLQTPAHALGDSDMTFVDPAQMSNKLNNLIIIVNNKLFNLIIKLILIIILTMISIKYFSINNLIYLSNKTCIVWMTRNWGLRRR
jgi:hypothetical protein